MSNKVFFTPEGYNKLIDELEKLQKIERPKIIKEIEEARTKGDLSENAEYHAAKEKQVFIEKRITEISNKINKACIIDPNSVPKDKISFGCKVKLLNTDTDEEVEYMIVGEDEANPNEGKISVNSPIALALLGKEVGDIVTVKVPAGVKNFEIEDIS
ncbi:transcription elongation factor GreA [Desulfurella acetivorans A63]|jgi:transcription elongation factor GreA|nr:transcription elongation factor GreA [Desulfurella acetivorans A63]